MDLFLEICPYHVASGSPLSRELTVRLHSYPLVCFSLHIFKNIELSYQLLSEICRAKFSTTPVSVLALSRAPRLGSHERGRWRRGICTKTLIRSSYVCQKASATAGRSELDEGCWRWLEGIMDGKPSGFLLTPSLSHPRFTR